MDHHGIVTRRMLIQGLATALASTALPMKARAQPAAAKSAAGPYSADVLPAGIRSRFVNNVNGLRMHVLEAGFESRDRPAVLLVHGYPELAYSWRKVMAASRLGGVSRVRP